LRHLPQARPERKLATPVTPARRAIRYLQASFTTS
jgi:hypothetical protein